MPYRDAVPNAALARGESRHGARIAGAGALVIPIVFLLPLEWSVQSWAYWVLLLSRCAMIGGAVYFMLRTDDRSTLIALRVAVGALAVAAVLFVCFPPGPGSRFWLVLRPWLAKRRRRSARSIRSSRRSRRRRPFSADSVSPTKA
jgi:hypothetical protein